MPRLKISGLRQINIQLLKLISAGIAPCHNYSCKKTTRTLPVLGLWNAVTKIGQRLKLPSRSICRYILSLLHPYTANIKCKLQLVLITWKLKNFGFLATLLYVADHWRVFLLCRSGQVKTEIEHRTRQILTQTIFAFMLCICINPNFRIRFSWQRLRLEIGRSEVQPAHTPIVRRNW